MIETLTTAVIVMAVCLVGLALSYGVLLSDQNKRIARIKKDIGALEQENKTLCKPDVVFELQKDLQESLSENLTHANKKAQQFKTERDKFEQMINEECERGYQMEGKYRDMKEERDTLIDDLSWYKAKVSRLERENERLRSRLDEFLEHDYDNQKLYKENRNLLSEFSQHIGNKPSSSKYKYFRGKLDGLGIREGE